MIINTFNTNDKFSFWEFGGVPKRVFDSVARLSFSYSLKDEAIAHIIWECTTNFPYWNLGVTQGVVLSNVMAGIQLAFPALQLAHRYHDVVLAVRLWDFHSNHSRKEYNSEIKPKNIKGKIVVHPRIV